MSLVLSVSPLTLWKRHRGKNCYRGHGAEVLDPVTRQVASLLQCKELCRHAPKCAGILVDSTSSTGSIGCWLRSNIVPAACDDDPKFDLHLAPTATPVMSPELLAALDTYSLALYGAPGVLFNTSFRVLWPELLPADVLDTLAVRCNDVLPSEYEADTVMFIGGIAYRDLYQQGAIWVHRPLHTLPISTVNIPDHAWVEGAHCGYELEEVTQSTPMWFLTAPGSGVHIKVGLSKRFGRPPIDMRYDGANWVVHEGYWWRTDTEVEIHKSLMRGDISRASQWAGEDLSVYDSVQFPLFAPDQGNWMGETFTEVVMLRMLTEPNFLSDYVVRHAQDGLTPSSAHLTKMSDYLRCGSPKALRVCRSDDAAIMQMSRQCADGNVRAVARVASNAGCQYPDRGPFVAPGFTSEGDDDLQ